MKIHNKLKVNVSQPLIFNLVLWAFSFVLLLYAFSGDEKPQRIDYVYTGCFLVTIFIPVMINLYLLIPLFLKQEKYIIYCLFFLFNLFIFIQLNIWFFNYLVDFLFPDYFFISYHSKTKLIAIFCSFLVGTTLIKLSIDWFYFNKNLNKELTFKNQQIQAELALLRSQINPHFLFNSLNVIYALAIENKVETKDAIVQLSDILRYVIYDSNAKYVTLKNEISLLKNYIEFQQFRHQQLKDVSFSQNIEDEDYQIYPMLLLPLIENSFKHGYNGKSKQSYININLCQEGDVFLFEIENNITIKHPEDNGYSGVGLDNIKKNIEIVYPECHNFKVEKTEDSFKVILRIYSHEN